MLSNDNRNRLLGATLMFAGVVGFVAPPVPAARLCPLNMLQRVGVHVGYVAAPSAPRARRAPKAKVANARFVELCLSRL